MKIKSTLLISVMKDRRGKIVVCIVTFTMGSFRVSFLIQNWKSQESQPDTSDGMKITKSLKNVEISGKSDKILLQTMIRYRYVSPFSRERTVFCLENRVDMSDFWIRLSSFATYPNSDNSPVSLIRLAEAGFFYTGSEGIVKCFCCGLRIYKWYAGECTITRHKHLSPDCTFIKNRNRENSQHNGPTHRQTSPNQSLCSNTMLGNSNLTNSQTDERRSASEEHAMENSHRISTNQIDEVRPVCPRYALLSVRLESFSGWNYTNMQNPYQLAEAGFYSIGEADVVRCFCCNIGLREWDKDDDPWVEHARHSPSCRYLRNKRGNDFVERVHYSWRQIYSPKHPSLSNYYMRLQSFRGWPSELQQTPYRLSSAGFYYTGIDDQVRCHYCDGGLRNWERGDNPWIEHARWFPFCRYVIKIKGLAFIEDVTRRFTTPSQESSSQQSSDEPGRQNHHCDEENCQLNGVPNVLQSRAAQSLIQCGCDRRSVLVAIREFFKRGGDCSDFTAVDLFTILCEVEEEEENLPPDQGILISTNSTSMRPVSSLVFDPFQKIILCRICKERECAIVFVPCGHRVTCQRCSDVLFCPECGDWIDKKMKTYLC